MSSKLHPNIKLLTWFNLCVDFTLYGPIAILYFSKITGSYALGLSIFSIEMISSSVFELPTGVLSDYIGRRKTVIFGALCAVVAGIFYAIGINYLFLIIGAIFAGLARSFYSGNNDALLHESLQENNQEEEYSDYSGKVSSMFQIALAISALLGGIISYWSFALVMWLSVIPRLVGFLISLKLIEPKLLDNKSDTNVFNHLKESFVNFRQNKELRSLSLASILSYGVGETMHQFKAAFIATLWPLWAIGISSTLSHVWATIGFRTGSYLSKKFGFLKVLFIGSIFNPIFSLIMLITANVISPLIMPLTSFTYGVSSVAKDTLFQKHFTNKQRATMGSLNSLVGSMFFGIFAVIFGAVADKIHPTNAMIIGEILMFSVAYIYWKLYKNLK
jgi:MFS family permease